MITVTLRGGLVEEVLSDDPKMEGHPAVILDYDVEGADDEDVSSIMGEECYIRGDVVQEGGEEFLKQVEKAQ